MKFKPMRAKVQEKSPTFCEMRNDTKVIRKIAEFEFGAVQKRVNLVDLEKMLQNEPSVQKLGFDTAENRPSKVEAASNQPPKALGSNEHLCQRSRGIHHRSLPLQKFPA